MSDDTAKPREWTVQLYGPLGGGYRFYIEDGPEPTDDDLVGELRLREILPEEERG